MTTIMEVSDTLNTDTPAVDIPLDAPNEQSSYTNYRSSLTDWIIPPLVVLYIATVFVYTTRVVYQQYLVDHLKLTSFLPQLYLASVCTFLPILLLLYLSLYLLPQHHSAPPAVPPQQVLDRSIPFECADREGGHPRCWKDTCNGRWKPSRVRHCGICKRCRVGFDHCCPWLATCVTTSTYLPFLLFLFLVPVTVLFLLPPFTRPLLAHASEVWTFARDPDGPITMRWFNWRWSWVLGIGPVGRLMVGFIWASWIWNKKPVESWESGGGLFLGLVGVLVALIAVGLFISTSLSINQGRSPIESRIFHTYRRLDPRLYTTFLRSSPPPPSPPDRLALDSIPSNTALNLSRADPRVLIWIPHPTLKGRGKAIYTRPDERPFDLGWKKNWKTIWREGIRDGFRVWGGARVGDSASTNTSFSRDDPRDKGLISLNENVLSRLRYEVSLAFDEEDEEEEQAQQDDSDDEEDLIVL